MLYEDLKILNNDLINELYKSRLNKKKISNIIEELIYKTQYYAHLEESDLLNDRQEEEVLKDILTIENEFLEFIDYINAHIFKDIKDRLRLK
jgi:hypothetical protein